eukprot:49626-Chlamydomonas_euryale.AAC.2
MDGLQRHLYACCNATTTPAATQSLRLLQRHLCACCCAIAAPAAAQSLRLLQRGACSGAPLHTRSPQHAAQVQVGGCGTPSQQLVRLTGSHGSGSSVTVWMLYTPFSIQSFWISVLAATVQFVASSTLWMGARVGGGV